MTGTSRAWALIAMGDGQQYAGNQGYADDPQRVYSYDSKVANHKNLSVGDLVFIRDRQRLLGIATIQDITSKPGQKLMRRCPICRTVDLKGRKTVSPTYRCDEGHEFNEPLEQPTDVTQFDAHYADTFLEAAGAVSVAQLKAAAPRRSDQLSIEEVDLARLERSLVEAIPAAHRILATFYQRSALLASQAIEDSAASASEGTSYTTSLADTRVSILRSIKARRGQQRFRNALLKRYGHRCMVTGCSLVHVLEAAHIWPYRGEMDNHVDNGLILRADIHTLFDLDLLAIEPVSLRVQLAPELKVLPEYTELENVELKGQGTRRPAHAPLTARWEVFCARWRI